MLSLWVAFFILVAIGTSNIDTTNFSHSDWKYLPIAIPMIIAGFVFHSIIPTICRDAQWSSDIWKPIALGLFMGFVMNTLWLVVAVGVVPEFGHISLNEARLTGIPITLEMSKILQSDLFLTMGTLFALIAIATSYVSIGMSLKDFSKDILENSFNIYNKWVLYTLAFIPPLIVSYLFADVFLKALNIVGGIGIVLLFGILPSIIYYRQSSSKLGILMSIIFFTAFSITFLITLLQTFGMLHLHPAG
jgi:tyrosine-specific transport protein